MRQLSGFDAAFLNVETATMPQHVATLLMLDAKPRVGRDQVRRAVAERIHLLAPFRERLVEVPFGLDHPYWVEDPDFDLDYHIRSAKVPPPGTEAQLLELVAEIHARPLDRDHPLWEMYVISGLRTRRVGLLVKLHHSSIDGTSGGEVIAALLDSDPAAMPPLSPAPLPGRGRMLFTGMQGLARRPIDTMRVVRDSVELRPWLAHVGRMAGVEPHDGGSEAAVPSLQAPPTRFNVMASPKRSLAAGCIPLAGVKAIKDAHGVTVNDVVMALCAGGLRRYLSSCGELPDEPMQAVVPMSVRSAGDFELGNQVTGMIAKLPTDVPEPGDRLRATVVAMNLAKERDIVPPELLGGYTKLMMPVFVKAVARMASRAEWAQRVRLPMNVVISNVPGPRDAWHMAGAKVRNVYPLSTIFDGCVLNISVHSYRANLEIGIAACADALPDPDDLMAALHAEYEQLGGSESPLPAG
jgi:WS/DGAT/MGAT family acyltransferase